MTGWFALKSAWNLGMVRQLRLPRVECGICGLWAGATAFPTRDVTPLGDLDLDTFSMPVGRQGQVAEPSRVVAPGVFREIAAAVEARMPEVKGSVSAGMSFGLAHEWTRTARPPQLMPVQFAGLFEGLMLAESAGDALQSSRVALNAELLPVSLRSDRGAVRYVELRFPFAARSPSWLWSADEQPCPECSRQRHKWRGLVRSSIPEHATHFNVADFTTKFVVREDLAAALAEVAGPTLSFVPVDVHEEPGG